MDGLRSNIQAEVNLILSPKASMTNGNGNVRFLFLLRKIDSHQDVIPSDVDIFFWLSLTAKGEMFLLLFPKKH